MFLGLKRRSARFQPFAHALHHRIPCPPHTIMILPYNCDVKLIIDVIMSIFIMVAYIVLGIQTIQASLTVNTMSYNRACDFNIYPLLFLYYLPSISVVLVQCSHLTLHNHWTGLVDWTGGLD